MELINRSAIIAVPGQPFLDWLHQVDPTSSHLTLADLTREPAFCLVPERESRDEALNGLRDDINRIFEEQLDGWYRIPAAWPKERDLQTFVAGLNAAFIPRSLIWARIDCDTQNLDDRSLKARTSGVWSIFGPYAECFRGSGKIENT